MELLIKPELLEVTGAVSPGWSSVSYYFYVGHEKWDFCNNDGLVYLSFGCENNRFFFLMFQQDIEVIFPSRGHCSSAISFEFFILPGNHGYK